MELVHMLMCVGWSGCLVLWCTGYTLCRHFSIITKDRTHAKVACAAAAKSSFTSMQYPRQFEQPSILTGLAVAMGPLLTPLIHTPITSTVAACLGDEQSKLKVSKCSSRSPKGPKYRTSFQILAHAHVWNHAMWPLGYAFDTMLLYVFYVFMHGIHTYIITYTTNDIPSVVRLSPHICVYIT